MARVNAVLLLVPGANLDAEAASFAVAAALFTAAATAAAPDATAQDAPATAPVACMGCHGPRLSGTRSALPHLTLRVKETLPDFQRQAARVGAGAFD